MVKDEGNTKRSATAREWEDTICSELCMAYVYITSKTYINILFQARIFCSFQCMNV